MAVFSGGPWECRMDRELPAMRRFRLASLVLVAQLVAAGRADPAPRRVRAADLEHGSVERRLEALAAILEIPPERRDPAMWDALRRESVRMLPYRRGQKRVSEADQETYSTYTMGLLKALGESRDPATIPYLLEFASSGTLANNGLARFGSLAISALLPAARAPQDGSDGRSGAIGALAVMLEGMPGMVAPLTDADRKDISALAEELLGPRFWAGNGVAIAHLALGTGRPDLRAQLEELADSRDAWIRRSGSGRSVCDSTTAGDHQVSAHASAKPSSSR